MNQCHYHPWGARCVQGECSHEGQAVVVARLMSANANGQPVRLCERHHKDWRYWQTLVGAEYPVQYEVLSQSEK